MPESKSKRIVPFHTAVNDKLDDWDIRLNVIKHLVHVLDGIITPYGDLKKKLLFAEIGTLIHDNMVWICVPNGKELEDKYKEAIKNSRTALKFNYNDLVVNLCTKKITTEEERVSSEKLVKFHFITVNKNQAVSCSINCSEETCEHDEKMTDKDICYDLNKIIGCDPSDICEWFNFFKINFLEQATTDISHTFFIILKPGSYFRDDIETLKNGIIGGAVFHWDKSPPSDDEILYLRRNIINTLWAELGPHLCILKLEPIVARAFAPLADLQINVKPFVGDTHDDVSWSHRRRICRLLSKKNNKEDRYSTNLLCSNCPSGNITFEGKKTYNIIGTAITEGDDEDSTDFCGSIDNYKGMFEHDPTNFHKFRLSRTKFNNDSKLLQYVLQFLEMDITLPNMISIPYGPSWLFLATLQQLCAKLTEPTVVNCTCTGEIQCFIHIAFKKNNDTAIEKLVKGMSNKELRGTTAKAILDVLHGRLSSLDDYLTGLYPNDPIAQKISRGCDNRLMEYLIEDNIAEGNIILKLRPLTTQDEIE